MCGSLTINVRENWLGNQKWTIRRQEQHVEQKMQNEDNQQNHRNLKG